MIYLFGQFLKFKFNITDITFIELYNLTKKKLSIIGTNYTKIKEECFNHNNTPDMSVITALRISISIPIIFTPVKYNGDMYIDGCFKNGFPLDYCNKETTLGLCIQNINNNRSEDSLFLPYFFKNCLSILVDTISEKNMLDNNPNVIMVTNLAESVVKFEYE
jgi:predicted acylesterase/phospholipase RssA